MTATAERKVRSGMHADRDRAQRTERRRFERPAGHAAAVGGGAFQQGVLDDDREAEGDEERRQDVLAERAVQHDAL
jgi:hypothetical protein